MKFYKRISYSFITALVFGLACSIPLYFINVEHVGYTEISYAVLLIVSFFALFANADYLLNILKGKIAKSGAAIAHIGFALLIIGVLISTSKRVTLSKSSSEKKASSLGEGFDDKVSILLTQGDTLPMGPYLVTYTGQHRKGSNIYFNVDYLKLNKENKPEFDFTLMPIIQDNKRTNQKSPEPDTKHYLDRDVYTHVTFFAMNYDSTAKGKNAYGEAKNYVGHVGDTIFAGNALVIIDSLRSNIGKEQYQKADTALEVTAVLRALDAQSNVYKARPKYIIKKNIVIPKEDEIGKLGLKFAFWKINPEEGTIEIAMSQKLSNDKDFIVLEAYMFPYINVLWLGCIIMSIGTAIAIRERIRKFKLQSEEK